MKDALAIHRSLLEHERPHEIVRLRRAITSADELPEALSLPAECCLAVRVFRVDGRGVLQSEPRPEHAASAAGASSAAGAARPCSADQGGTTSAIVAVIASAATHPTPAAVRAATGALRAVPASSAMVNAVTDYSAPLVAPLLLPEAVLALLDRRIVDRLRPDDVVYTTTGEPRTALGIRLADLMASCAATPVELREPAVPGRRRLLTERIPAPRRTRDPERSARPSRPSARVNAAPRRQIDQGA